MPVFREAGLYGTVAPPETRSVSCPRSGHKHEFMPGLAKPAEAQSAWPPCRRPASEASLVKNVTRGEAHPRCEAPLLRFDTSAPAGRKAVGLRIEASSQIWSRKRPRPDQIRPLRGPSAESRPDWPHLWSRRAEPREKA